MNIMMASCSDLTKLSSFNNYRPLIKATPVPILSSKKLVEPFNRLKNRANLFRRRNCSSQLDISDSRSSLPADHFILPHSITTSGNNHHLVLKRSNSMICPQQRLQSLLKNNIHNKNRNSICVELPDCPTDESSTDEYSFIKSSSNRYFRKQTYPKMSHINEHDVSSSEESLNEKTRNEVVSSLPNNNNDQTSAILASSQLLNTVTGDEQKQQLVPSIPTFLSRENIEEPFYDCKQPILPDMSLLKLSACTMTGKSLNNLDESFSITSSEDKGVQTTFNESIMNTKRNDSSTSLSSSSTSIQTDSLDNKSTMSNLSINPSQSMIYHKRTNIHERLLNEETCIYWVNYLGSTAIKISNDNTPAMPTYAINRLKQSTQYASVLPIIGLSISSRGVEFLKHTKDRVVICFHDIKSIHCACQDQDLRYFAYVTREQRLINGTPNPTDTFNHKQHQSPSSDYHNYCHVFVVKNESMSTEILLTFGQAFDIAYQTHRRLNLKPILLEKSQSKLDANHPSTKPEKIMLLSAHSPATSSSSSSSEERRVFI
ncbi:hypothetical protein I4U23_025256 [Adineta vaga]|nr:hypothetical protein I4U23_025256 [Adineta vaga]